MTLLVAALGLFAVLFLATWLGAGLPWAVAAIIAALVVALVGVLLFGLISYAVDKVDRHLEGEQ